MLRELWRSGRRRLRIHQVQRRRKLHPLRPARWRLESHGIRPVERHAGGRPVDAGPAGAAHGCNVERIVGSTCNLGRSPPTSGRRTSTPRPSLTPTATAFEIRNEAGLALVATNIRFRDGSYSNFNNTDLNGNAGFNEMFPLFSWYVVETDSTRYKNTGTHVVYDAGGPADGTCTGTTAPCGSSGIAAIPGQHRRTIPVPADSAGTGRVLLRQLRTAPMRPSPLAAGGSGGSTGRFDRPRRSPLGSDRRLAGIFRPEQLHRIRQEALRGRRERRHPRRSDLRLDPAVRRSAACSSTPVDAERAERHDQPLQEGTAPDGSTSLTLVDTTKTSSWDDWAQGFRCRWHDPNMNCPGRADSAPTPICSSSRCTTSRIARRVQQRHGTPAHTAAEQLPVQVLRRHAQLEPGAAGAVRRHVPVPERHGASIRRPASRPARTARSASPNPDTD